MKDLLQFLASIGFLATGTDAFFTPIYKHLTYSGPFTEPNPNIALIQGLFIIIGLLLLGHILYKLWKEISAKRY
jgi:hypothetical protein